MAGGDAESAAPAVQEAAFGCERKRQQAAGGDAAQQMWSYDFVSDQTSAGRRLTFSRVRDEFTRERLALEVDAVSEFGR